MKISFVLPMLNEELSIEPLYEQLARLAEAGAFDTEFIFVDDGSRDRSADIVTRIHQSDARVKLISLSRNFGQQVALAAGLDAATGDAAVTMDSDLQHPPEIVSGMIAAWKAGAEVVSAVRRRDPDAGFLKRVTSRAFYRLFRALSSVPLIERSPELRLLDRRAIQSLRSFPEHHRFLRGMIAWAGFRTSVVEFDATPRRSGKSRFTLRKMLGLAFDALTSFSTAPLQLAAVAGFILVGLGTGYLGYVLAVRLFTTHAVPGWASIISVILVVCGFQMILTAVVGLYVGRIFEEVKRRPLYLVRNTLGLDSVQKTP